MEYVYMEYGVCIYGIWNIVFFGAEMGFFGAFVLCWILDIIKGVKWLKRGVFWGITGVCIIVSQLQSQIKVLFNNSQSLCLNSEISFRISFSEPDPR